MEWLAGLGAAGMDAWVRWSPLPLRRPGCSNRPHGSERIRYAGLVA